MANIAFKRGLHASLPFGNATDGVFYLTTDSHRLYVGQGTELVDLNKYIKTVESVADLAKITDAHEGDFYYVKEGNILAVWEAAETGSIGGVSTGHFVQVNSDANDNDNDDTYLNSVESEVSKDTKNNVVVTQTFHQYKKDLTNPADEGNEVTPAITTEFIIPVSDIVAAGIKVGTGVQESTTSNAADVITTGSGADTGSVATIKGGNNVTVAVDTDGSMVISADEPDSYTIGSAAGSTAIKLESSNLDASVDTTVTLEAGKQIALDGSTKDKIIIKHADLGNATATPEEAATLEAQGSFTVVTDITNDNGHITGYKTKEFTLPEDKDTKYVIDSVAANNAGELKVGLKVAGSNEDAVITTSGKDLFYKVTINGEEKTIYNQGDLTPIVNHIDTKLQDLNALTYKGTVSDGSLPTSAANGDVYMVAELGTYGGVVAEPGDLFIAQGEEVNGVIANPTWTYVPSGDDTDTQYTLSGENNKWILTASTGDSTEVIVNKGTDITVTIANDTFVASHDEVANTKSEAITGDAGKLAHSGKFTVVTGVSRTATGHVDGITTTEFTLPTDNNTTYDLTAADGNIVLKGLNNTEDKIAVSGGKNNDSIVVTCDNDAISIEHADYEFAAPTGVTTGATAYGQELTVITGASVENGHIIGLTTGKLTLPASDNVNTTYQFSNTSTVADNHKSVTFTETLAGSDNSTHTATQVLSTTHENIQFTSATNGAQIDLVWGTF